MFLRYFYFDEFSSTTFSFRCILALSPQRSTAAECECVRHPSSALFQEQNALVILSLMIAFLQVGHLDNAIVRIRICLNREENRAAEKRKPSERNREGFSIQIRSKTDSLGTVALSFSAGGGQPIDRAVESKSGRPPARAHQSRRQRGSPSNFG